MLSTPTPTPEKRLFETMFSRLLDDVRRLKGRTEGAPDPSGRYRIGDIYITQEPLDDDTIRLTIQNALTNGDPLILGDLP